MSRVRISFLLLQTLLIAGVMYSQVQSPSSGENSGPTIHLHVNRVLVPVLVLDKAGHPVVGLTKDDFQVFDEGKPHQISALTVFGNTFVRSDAVMGDAHPGRGDTSQTRPQRFVVFLFDDLHMGVRDLSFVRKAASAVLSSSLDASDYAGLLSTSTKTYAPLSRDRAKLLQAIDGVQTQHALQPQYQTDCPDISYYQAVQIDRERTADAPAFQSAVNSAAVCFPNVPQQLLENIVRETVQKVISVGRQDAISSFGAISSAIRAMSFLKGERHLILVSPGFEALEQDSLIAESNVLDLALASNVTISALDARGLYVTNVGAEEKGVFASNANAVQEDLRQTSMSNASSTMASLAYGTGGRYFHNSNDLQKGFRDLTQIPNVEYVLELSARGLKADGRYHALRVKVRMKGVSLIARRGYVVPRPQEAKNQHH